ncbi:MULTISPECIES: flagellin [unclassified Devosia]|uniref:flagellin N-terminal helical domain-containing protein n=1 Tax=unclassified Devosia TaxID=196773 RepID=UPI001555F969|nr:MULTISPECIES: flagellin [unclassified Devosia]
MSDISLSKAVRSNLLSLQNTATMMAKTQDRLSSGNKVNSALDNPTNFFTAASLNSRAGDLNQLMDSMANGIQTLEAADNGLTSITKTLESMQSTLRQARQDKTFQTQSFKLDSAFAAGDKLTFSGGAVGGDVEVEVGTISSPVGTKTNLPGGTFAAIAPNGADQTFTVNGTTVTLTDDEDSLAKAITKINTALGAGHAVEAYEGAANQISFRNKNAGPSTITVAGTTTALGTLGTEVPGTAPNRGAIDSIVNAINDKAELQGKIRASNDNGTLRIENLSTQKLDISGASTSGGVTGKAAAKSSVGGNTVRSDLANQFNELRDQLDKLSDDASFNGINLLRGDNLKITFNETGTSSIDIHTKSGKALNSANLKLTDIVAQQLDSDGDIDVLLNDVKLALSDVRSQSSTFGQNLSIVQNRQDFTKNMINTLETGASNLTLADMNEEAANLLALQTRQSLSSSSLSLASQADQSVLQLLQ